MLIEFTPTYRWKEQSMADPDAKGYEEVNLSVTVEIVTGEVVDIIYQVFPNLRNLVILIGLKTIERKQTILQKW